MLTAEWDPGLRPEFADGMPALCSNLELRLVDRVGHWMKQEAPAVVNERLISWLKRVAGFLVAAGHLSPCMERSYLASGRSFPARLTSLAVCETERRPRCPPRSIR